MSNAQKLTITAALLIINLLPFAQGQVLIEWEPNREADFSHYLLYRSATPYCTADPVARVQTPHYVDNNVPEDIVYYWVSAVDKCGNESDFCGPVEVVPNAEASNVKTALPARTTLGNNFPNPFNPSTAIPYWVVSHEDNPIPVNIKIYNSAGQIVRTLVDNYLPQGEYICHWNGRNQEGFQVSNGIYICCLKAGTYSAARMLILAK